MFLAAQFDKYIKHYYTMSAANLKKLKVLEKLGQGNEIIKKTKRETND